VRAVVVFSKRINLLFLWRVVDEREGGSHGLKFDRSILIDFWTLFFSQRGYHILRQCRKQMVVCYEYIFQLYVKMETLLSLETDATRVPWVLKLTSQTASL